MTTQQTASPTSNPTTDRALEWLVRVARFALMPRAEGDPVELCRWWTRSSCDRLIVRSETDAELQRLHGVDPREPTAGQLVCRDRRSVAEIAAVVQAWGPPTPTSCPLSVRLS